MYRVTAANQFHGRAYEDFRNAWLNANSWTNDANQVSKPALHLNDFGVSVGGPILHDKLFYFGTYAMKKQPGSVIAYNDIFTAAAQSGNFTYTGTDGTPRTINLLQVAGQSNSGLPTTVNSSDCQSVHSDQHGGFERLAYGERRTPTTSRSRGSTVRRLRIYYPAVRVDYNLSEKARMNLSWLMTKTSQPSNTAADFPGSGFSNQIAGSATKNYTSSYGFDYTISPRLINQFKAGFLYDATAYAYNASPLYETEPSVAWNYPGVTYPMSGQAYNLPISTYYPIFNLSDSMTWQKGRHTVQYGVSWYREQDHYWNAPAGFSNYALGLATGDPAINAFTNSGTNADAAGCRTTRILARRSSSTPF